MSTSAGSLDANILLRVLLNDIAKQHQAAVQLLENSGGQLAVADTAIIEIVFVLVRYYKFSRTQAREAIEGLLSLPNINCNRPLFQKALPLFVKRPDLSFEDCCLALYATLNDAEPLWTFDRKLATHAPSARLLA